MDVIFVGLKNNIFYKSLIISIICFTYSLNSYPPRELTYGGFIRVLRVHLRPHSMNLENCLGGMRGIPGGKQCL